MRNNNNTNFLIASGILAAASIIGFLSCISSYFYLEEKIKMFEFPRKIGAWISEDIVISEHTYRLRETKNIILRNYKNKRGDTINLYIIYSRGNRQVSQPPEIFLQGEGATITSAAPLKITDSVNATSLILEKNTSRNFIAYWYKIGKLNTNSYLTQQLKAAIDRTLGRKNSVALIRISTKIADGRQDAALNNIKAFCALIEPLLDKYVP